MPLGYRLRPARRDDADAIAVIKRAVELDRLGESDVTVQEVYQRWALPRLDPAGDVWVIEHGGEPVAYGVCWVESPPWGVVAEQAVTPQHRGRDLSELLLDLGEARAEELARAAPADKPVALGVWAHERDGGRLELFARHGYKHVRTFYRLDRKLTEPVEHPEWPRGIAVRRFRSDMDEAALHAASEEAFRDHFRPAAMDLEEWREYRFARNDFDIDLWFVAWDRNDVAGSILAIETPSGGYIDELFVRRPWRGHGLGRALLLHEMRELRRRRVVRAYLGVDSANPTGAMRLYESVGLRAERGAALFFEIEVPRGG